VSEYFGTLTRPSVHPASAIKLTLIGPLATVIQPQGSIKQPRALTHLKFELRHSSPSFGTQQIRSDSDLSQVTDRSMLHPARRTRDHTSANAPVCLHFHCAFGFDTQLLAYMLDSLVRVTRRVEERHLIRIVQRQGRRPWSDGGGTTQHCSVAPHASPGSRSLKSLSLAGSSGNSL